MKYLDQIRSYVKAIQEYHEFNIKGSIGKNLKLILDPKLRIPIKSSLIAEEATVVRKIGNDEVIEIEPNSFLDKSNFYQLINNQVR